MCTSKTFCDRCRVSGTQGMYKYGIIWEVGTSERFCFPCAGIVASDRNTKRMLAGAQKCKGMKNGQI